MPIAELLLKRACPEGEWVLKRDGVAYWALTTDPHTRVYVFGQAKDCLLYTSPSPRDLMRSRMPSSA